jgi:hypothetical protein
MSLEDVPEPKACKCYNKQSSWPGKGIPYNYEMTEYVAPEPSQEID